MTITKITALPPAPVVTDTESQFATKASAFVSALDGFVTDANALASDVDSALAGNLVQFDGFSGVWSAGTFNSGQVVFHTPTDDFYIALDDNETSEPPNGSWRSIGVDLDKVLKPSGVSPTGTLPNSPDSETPTLEGSFYYHLGDVSHASSQFQVSTSDTDFDSNIVYDSGTISATLTHQVPAGNLTESTTFYFRLKYIDANGLESEFSDPVEFSTDLFFDYADPANIGQQIAGGFLVGVIDTVAGTIDSQDAYQTGERYAVIVSPKSLESSTGLKWNASGSSSPNNSDTRWDGLSATNAILSLNNTDYEAHDYISNVRSSNPPPTLSGGSDWYLPALDELELIYRNLKSQVTDNFTGTLDRGFPAPQSTGQNTSSDPTGDAYTTSDPSQTNVLAFQEGKSEAMGLKNFWTSSWGNTTTAHYQEFKDDAGRSGAQTPFGGNMDFTSIAVRPVRRISL